MKPMLTRTAIWAALDAAVAESGLSKAKALRLVDLDGKLLSPSHRMRHWPTMSTVSAILTATNVTPARFAEMVQAHIEQEQAA